MSEYIVIGTIIAAFAVAAVLSYFFTPPVKNFAHKVGAIDVPKDARRTKSRSRGWAVWPFTADSCVRF